MVERVMGSALVAAVLLCGCATTTRTAAPATKVSVAANDTAWDGTRVPDGMQCGQQAGREPATPPLLVSGIPPSAGRLVVEFNDESYNDTDGAGHIGTVFRLAEEFGVDADFHVDFFDEPDHLHINEIAEQTVKASWQGRVTVGHLTELAALRPADQDAIIARIKNAGIGVISLPATDLYLMGRHDESNVRRGLTPIRRLMDVGVPVALASNNIRNPFTPVGTADLTHMAFLAAVAAHMGTPDQIRQLFAGITVNPARMLRLSSYGVDVGARADLVLRDCDTVEDVVATLPSPVVVVRRGQITVECDHRRRERWRTA